MNDELMGAREQISSSCSERRAVLRKKQWELFATTAVAAAAARRSCGIITRRFDTPAKGLWRTTHTGLY